MNEEQIRKRILEILSKQEALESLVSKMQGIFFENALRDWNKLLEDQDDFFNKFWRQFNNTYQAVVLGVIAKDLEDILISNQEYFLAEAGSTKAIKAAIEEVTKRMIKAFGFSDTGKVVQGGYISEIQADITVKRAFKGYIIKLDRNTVLTEAQTADLELYIKGDDKTKGIWESYYSQIDRSNSSIFDVYQKADRMIQDEMALELQLDAAMYVGGLIETSRDFCRARNGKIFLRSEIAQWAKLEWSGKPKSGYDPFVDLGGYYCRHHLSYLGNATAMRLDKTLELENNKLYRIK